MHSPWKRWVAETLVPSELCANWSTPRRREDPTSFARRTPLRRLPPQLPALFRLAIQRLRNRRRPPHLAQLNHFNLKLPALILDPQQIPDPHFARRLRLMPIRLNPPHLASPPRQRSSLKKPGRPQPFIDPNRHLLYATQ